MACEFNVCMGVALHAAYFMKKESFYSQGPFQLYIQVSDDNFEPSSNRVANIHVSQTLRPGSTLGSRFYPTNDSRVRIELSFQVHCDDNFTGMF